MFDRLQISRNMALSMKFFRIISRNLTGDLLHNLIIQTDILSCPSALLVLRVVIIFNITPSLKPKE